MAGQPFQVGRFAHEMRVRLMREHLGVDVDGLMSEELDAHHTAEPTAMSQEEPTPIPTESQKPHIDVSVSSPSVKDFEAVDYVTDASASTSGSPSMPSPEGVSESTTSNTPPMSDVQERPRSPHGITASRTTGSMFSHGGSTRRHKSVHRPKPNVDPHGFDDPLSPGFYEDVWTASAQHNVRVRAYRVGRD